jgi:hypothetical protein
MTMDTRNAAAGFAALAICESLLLALSDLEIMAKKDTDGVLVDAAAGSTWVITHSVIAEAVDIRCIRPLRHPSPRKSPSRRNAMTASLPCSETVSFTLPLWMKNTESAGSPA